MMFQNYLSSISQKYQTGEFLEHTFRTDFEILLNTFVKQELKKELQIIQEPQREKFGAPDFKILNNTGNIIGYVECKNITEDISELVHSPQIQKYLDVTHNLLLTNYIDFILFKNKEILNYASLISKLDLKENKITVKDSSTVYDILKKFFLTPPEKVASTKKLSLELANRTRMLYEFVLQEMQEDKTKSNQFYIVYKIFKTMTKDLDLPSFVDMYAQIVSFGLLFFRLSKDMLLTKENILANIPDYIPLLKDVFHNARFDKWSSSSLWMLEEILLLLNNVDVKLIKESLSYKELSILQKRDKNLTDPFLFFYEEFLEVYDKETKVKRGVFYTPESVVSFIVRSLDVILKEKLKVKNGFLDKSIKVLDFATGTGTFLLALIEFIREELYNTNNLGLFNMEVNEFILKNVYGFELLPVPYILCHLRIHEFLESYGFHYNGNKKQRAQVYLTNTLENRESILFTEFFRDIDEEARLAHNVKNKEEILVIMGNPPYSVSSVNKTAFIENLMEMYKEVVKEEKNIQPLSDDYIKFIRFAHWKMEQVPKGVVGIITNNSYLDGVIHRGMREELIKTFDEIYILNLHGNSNIGETTPDGSKDENVFDIKQGVSISLFVKTGKKRNGESGVYYYSLQGLREQKFEYLYSRSIQTTRWKKLECKAPEYWFKRKDLHGERKYKKFWSVKEIFGEYNSGIEFGRDNLFVEYQKEVLSKRLEKLFSGKYDHKFQSKFNIKDTGGFNFIERLNKTDYNPEYISILSYRPFDFRYCYYHVGLIRRPSFEVMKHGLNNKNLFLISQRITKPSWKHAFVSRRIIDKHVIGELSYAFPLYLYPTPNSTVAERKPNFTEKFQNFLKEKNLHKKTPEQILGYIYAILYSPTYRSTYYEFLKIDFPRIPFPEDVILFNKLSKRGSDLIDLHLLNVEFEKSIVSFPVENPNLHVTKVEYKNKQVWINDTTYFQGVNEEVWNYTIGGYQVLEKWLKERKKASYTL
ncbi:MAG: type ISP restriction/modification enzyme, partial [Candidatus Pacearchaeota archaeon]